MIENNVWKIVIMTFTLWCVGLYYLCRPNFRTNIYSFRFDHCILTWVPGPLKGCKKDQKGSTLRLSNLHVKYIYSNTFTGQSKQKPTNIKIFRKMFFCPRSEVTIILLMRVCACTVYLSLCGKISTSNQSYEDILAVWGHCDPSSQH